MAPALRMTRSIKEKLQIFFFLDPTVRTPKHAISIFLYFDYDNTYRMFYGVIRYSSMFPP